MATWFVLGMALLTALALFAMIGVGAAARRLGKGMESDVTGLGERTGDIVATLRFIRETQDNLASRVENLELILEEDLQRIRPKTSNPLLELPDSDSENPTESTQEERDRLRS